MTWPTSVVFEGEVVVVCDLRGQAEGEVLPVSHLVLVHRADGFNNLTPTRRETPVRKEKTLMCNSVRVGGGGLTGALFFSPMFAKHTLAYVPSPASPFHT